MSNPIARPATTTRGAFAATFLRGGVRKAAAILTAFAVLLPVGVLAAPAPATAAPIAYGAPDAIAADYYAALLRHTRWTESVWDAKAGVYQFTDFNFAVVLGNAVVLTHGEYDEQITGVSKADLRSKTVATIKHYAALNRFVNPNGTWGRKLFWDSTFQSYFLDAGKLMWDDLDEQTRTNLDAIAVGQSTYTADLDHGQDPLSGSWTADWPTGKYQGDTAQEEAGVYTQALAPGLAWAPENADAARWTEQFGDWVRNSTGQPTADVNNPAVVAGKPISTNTMHNIYDTYIVENHGSFGPHYQSDIWRSGGRNAIQFILNDQPIPDILTEQPNSDELWNSIKLVMSGQGEPFMPMVADREFLYGRDVIPLAFLGQVLRDPDAARAEANIAEALKDYQAYAPTDRLTKFSGEPKYEPEARAEIAIAYLLHVESAESEAGVVTPTPEDEFFERLTGVRDFGAAPGLTVQQSENAWAAASSHPGFVKFPWVPDHDSWLFYISGASSYLYPRTSATIDTRNTTTYTEPRDGFEGTASVFEIGDDHSGQVTLPTGSAIYASSGAGRDDGSLTVRNLDMDGYNGLDGSRTYTTAEGEVTEAIPTDRAADPLDVNAARVDTLNFEPTTARYVRMQGVQGNPTYGYSMYSFHVYGSDDATAPDLAAGATATASTEDAAGGRSAAKVTDTSPSSRWAVATSARTRGDSWIQVDLGAVKTVSSARLAWEASAGARYLVQTSTNGVDWTTQSTYGPANPADANVARLDTVALTPAGASDPAPVDARFVRMQGVQGNAAYGYSLYHLRALTADGTDVAANKPATASSSASGRAPGSVTDGSATSRWAVSVEDRSRDDSWVQVDLGESTPIAKVQLGWESAAGREYRIQTSLDGTTWTDAASYRFTGDEITSTDDRWVNVEGEAGFVVRGTDAPITVSREDNAHHAVRLVDSASASDSPFLVEMIPGDAAATAAQEAAPQPSVTDEGILASTLDGYLTLFNVTGADVETTVSVPYEGDTVSLFEGQQKLGADASTLSVTVPKGSAIVLAPRFDIARSEASTDLTATVTDGRSITLTGANDHTLSVRNVETDSTQSVQLSANQETASRFGDATGFPVKDLALSTITFPGSVLPAGMTSPALAVDGDGDTSWVPGPDGRMVVDLGAARDIGSVALVWDGRSVPDSVVSVSDDGLTFRDIGAAALTGRTGLVPVDGTARYVAVSTSWAEGDAAVSAFKVLPPGVVEPIAPGDIVGELPDWTVGEPATGSISVAGTPTPELAVTAGDLPAGVSFDPATGAFAGTPTEGGDFVFTVTASNGEGEPSSREFSGSVRRMAPTLFLEAAAANSTSGSLTATIRDRAGATVVAATGTVAFFESKTADGTPIATVEVENGVASTDLTRIEPGSTTFYSAKFTPSDAAAESYEPATASAVSLVTPDRGESTITATVTPTTWGTAPVATINVATATGPASGSVRVSVDSGRARDVDLSGGSATVTLSDGLGFGVHTLHVSYPGDSDTAPSTLDVTFTIAKATPTVSVSAPGTTYGTSAKVAVKVTTPGGPATGSVRVIVDGKTVKTLALSNGAAKVTLSKAMSANTHSVRVVYTGSSVANPTEKTVPLRVSRAATKVAISLSSSKATVKKSKLTATITVSVPGTTVRPDSKVQIKVGGKTVKTVTLKEAHRGRLKVTLPVFTKTGSRVAVTAQYLGNSNLLSKTSAPDYVKVVR